MLLLDDPRLLRWAAACWKRGCGASKGEPMVPMDCTFSDVVGLHRVTHRISLAGCLRLTEHQETDLLHSK